MRIVAGTLGGRRLVAPTGHTTRPTSERVREAMFAIVGDVQAQRVADLYAGTGALGLEALSRGAAHVTFVEHARGALLALRRNTTALGVTEQTTIVTQPVERSLHLLQGYGPFDLIFADPPYAALEHGPGCALRALNGLVRHGLVASSALLVLEHASLQQAPMLANLAITSCRRYGDTAVAFYELSAS